MAKIVTLSLVSRVSRASINKLLVFTTRTWYDLPNKKDFIKRYQQLAERFSKNLENHGFLVYQPSNSGHATGPQSWELCGNCCKSLLRECCWHLRKTLLIAFEVFHEFFYDPEVLKTIRGLVPTPQIPLTVQSVFIIICYVCLFVYSTFSR